MISEEVCVFPERKFLERIFLERVFPEKIILEMNFPRIKNSLNMKFHLGAFGFCDYFCSLEVMFLLSISSISFPLSLGPWKKSVINFFLFLNSCKSYYPWFVRLKKCQLIIFVQNFNHIGFKKALWINFKHQKLIKHSLIKSLNKKIETK